MQEESRGKQDSILHQICLLDPPSTVDAGCDSHGPWQAQPGASDALCE